MVDFYNTTFIDSANNIFELFSAIGKTTGDSYLIGTLTLLSLFIIMLVFTYKYNFLEVLLVDCFICSIVGILLLFAGILPASIIIIPFVIFCITLIIYLMS